MGRPSPLQTILHSSNDTVRRLRRKIREQRVPGTLRLDPRRIRNHQLIAPLSPPVNYNPVFPFGFLERQSDLRSARRCTVSRPWRFTFAAFRCNYSVSRYTRWPSLRAKVHSRSSDSFVSLTIVSSSDPVPFILVPLLPPFPPFWIRLLALVSRVLGFCACWWFGVWSDLDLVWCSLRGL